MQNPFTHKTYLDVSDNEFKKDRMWFVNSECHKSYFGLAENDREEFESVLRVAQANPAASCFPDFIFESGFIEHFQVTSSSVTRKGATHTRKESEFRRSVDMETKGIEDEWNRILSFDDVRSKSWIFSILYTLMNFCLIRLEATGSIIWRVAKSMMAQNKSVYSWLNIPNLL